MWFKFILMLSCLYDKKFVIPQNAIRFILIFVWSQVCHSLIILTLYPYVIFMGNFNIFFYLTEGVLLLVSTELTLILKIISHCFIKYIKTFLSPQKMCFEDIDIHYHQYSILSFRTPVILAILSVSTFIINVILYYKQIHIHGLEFILCKVQF